METPRVCFSKSCRWLPGWGILKGAFLEGGHAYLCMGRAFINIHFQILFRFFVNMIRKKTKTKEESCQSRFYKDWNPDMMADYNRWDLLLLMNR